MTAYLIDTNHAAQIMADPEILQARIAPHRNAEEQFYTCITVLSELYFAAYASKRKMQNLRNISTLAAIARLYDLVVLTSDRHFTFIDHLHTESWL